MFDVSPRHADDVGGIMPNGGVKRHPSARGSSEGKTLAKVRFFCPSTGICSPECPQQRLEVALAEESVQGQSIDSSTALGTYAELRHRSQGADVNWIHIFRIIESTWYGLSSASSRFLYALQALFPAQSGSRRPKAEACDHLERLEIRQVLSVANLAVVLNSAVLSEFEFPESGFDVPTPEQTAAPEAFGKADPDAVEQNGSESLHKNWEESDSIWNLAVLPAADCSSFPGVNTSRNLLNSSVAVSTTPSQIAVNTSTPNDLPTSSIDEVFYDTGRILDQSLPTSTIDESVPSAPVVPPVPAGLTPSPNNPIPVITAPVAQIASSNLPVTAPVFAIPVASESAPVSVDATSRLSSAWNWQITSPSAFGAQPHITATGNSKQSLTVPVEFPCSVGRRSIVSVNGDADHEGLAGLAVLDWFSTGYEPSLSGISTSPVPADTLPVAVPLVNGDVNRQLSLQNVTIPAQMKVKSFRAGQHHNSTSAKLVEVSHQHDSLPDLINTEDVPRALKYVVLPRGPPRNQPDMVLRIMDSDAESHVLQRLRYSIAPRGPSTVTVEMQSPEKRSFSGPRVSPEE